MKTVHLFNPNLTVAPSPVTGRSGRTIWPTLAIGRRFTMPFPDYEKLKLELCCGSGTKDGRWMVENITDDEAPEAAPGDGIDWEESAKMHAITAMNHRRKLDALTEENTALLSLLETPATDADATPLDTLKRVLEIVASHFPNESAPESRPGATNAEAPRESTALVDTLFQLQSMTPGEVKEAGKAAGVRYVGVKTEHIIAAIIAKAKESAAVTPHA